MVQTHETQVRLSTHALEVLQPMSDSTDWSSNFGPPQRRGKASKAVTLRVCRNTRWGDKPSCGGRGSEHVLLALADAVRRAGLDAAVEETVCLGHCGKGPNVKILPGGAVCHGVSLDTLEEVVLAAARTALERPS